MSFNVQLLDQQLRDAGLPIEGCSSSGRVDWIGTPTQQQLDSANAILAAHNPAELSTLQQVQINTSALRDYAELARNYHAEIKALMLAVTDADVNSSDTDSRVNAIGAVIVAAPTAFKNRYNAAFNAESGVTVAGLDVAALLLLTATQKQRYVAFARYFVAHYGLLLLWAGT